MFLYIAISCAILWYILMRWKYRKMYKLGSQLKNDLLCLPLLGHSVLLVGNNEDRMTVLQKFGRASFKTGGLTGIWLGQQLFVQIADPKSLEVVLKTSLEKDDIMLIEQDLLGNGSIFARVPIWRPRRKVIAPIFSPKNLNQFVEIFSERGSVMVDQLKTVTGKGCFPLFNYLTSYSMDSVCESALGIKMDSQVNKKRPFLEAFDQHCKMAAVRISMPPVAQTIYKYMPIYKTYMKHIYYMWNFVDELIQNKREEIKENLDKKSNSDICNVEKRKTFLELYIESSGGNSGFTNKELREETLVLLLAGTDTSAVGAAFTCLMLARHPEIQEKVYAEIQEIFGSTDRPLTTEDLPRLKYLEAVLKEALRMYPPVPIILRKIGKDTILPNGLQLPNGTSVIINIWAVHRNPEYWGPDAEEFRPERFIGHELKHPVAFMPFSYGPRSCLGYTYAMMSMKTSVAALVRNFRLSCDGDKPIRLKLEVMMKDVDEYELQLEPRH